MKQEVYTVSEETSIRDALHLITEKKISGVLSRTEIKI